MYFVATNKDRGSKWSWQNFFGGKKDGKCGRSSENKAQVAIALQLDDNGAPQYLKMQVIPNAKGEIILAFTGENIAENSTIHRDVFQSYHA